jgi:autotransporter-associated beta strand protein
LSFCVLGVNTAQAVAGNTWDGGGGGGNMNWSNPLNWSGDTLPSNSATLTFASQGSFTQQDLFSASGGIPNSSFDGLMFTSGVFNVAQAGASRALGLAVNGRISTEDNAAFNDFYDFGVPVVGNSNVRADIATNGRFTLAALAQRPGVPTNVQVGSDAAHSGTLVLMSASYTGTTTVTNGALRLGDFGTSVQTANQGDYTIGSAGSLFGYGTIGLSGGGRVANAGTIGISGDADLRSLTIDGDLVMEGGSTYAADLYALSIGAPYNRAGPIRVTDVLDLGTLSDTLLLSNQGVFPPNPPGAIVLATYGTRLGQFDNVVGLRPGWSILYTSPSNSGPGEIVLQLPEPTALAALPFAILPLLLRRPVALRA